MDMGTGIAMGMGTGMAMGMGTSMTMAMGMGTGTGMGREPCPYRDDFVSREHETDEAEAECHTREQDHPPSMGEGAHESCHVIRVFIAAVLARLAPLP